MKISEMSYAQASAVMLRIAAPISNICDDEELANILRDFVGMKQAPALRAYGLTLPRVLTYCLDKHKADTVEIISALLGIPVSQVGETPFKDIANGLQESYDEVLAGFFTRYKARKKSAVTA